MIPFPDLEDKIRFFFSSPATAPGTHSRQGLHSVLYLVRRELIETQGYDPNTDAESVVTAQGVKNRLFASLIVMFTAMDLLAKFEQGDAEGPGARFKAFLRSEHGAEMNPYTASLLWAARNSLVHAFSVPDSDSLTKLGMKGVAIGQRKIDNTSLGLGNVSVRSNGEYAIIYIDGIFAVLLSAIGNCHDSLYGSASADRRQTFESMFDRYGTLQIGVK